MITNHNVSLQNLSWIKSNKENFDKKAKLIPNVYYPENIKELENLLDNLYNNKKNFLVIGYSSNTLFLPSFYIENIIVTKRLNHWTETKEEIVCECGVNVSTLSKHMIDKGYIGFEGLTDLPGTIGAAVYGNCGCRNCSINSLVKEVILFTKDCSIKKLDVSDLNLEYRSTSLKRGELNGTIISIKLTKKQGEANTLKKIADMNHLFRLKNQPNASNNLGTTIIGTKKTTKGNIFFGIIKTQRKLFSIDNSNALKYTLLLFGKYELNNYLFNWNRYIFKDSKSHLLFNEYKAFINTLFFDAHLEIEIRE